MKTQISTDPARALVIGVPLLLAINENNPIL